MNDISEIRDAMLRLSFIARTRFHYDAGSLVFGEGEIHYLIEVSELFFIAWEDDDTKMMIVNPITRFGLDELEELGAEEAWTLLHVPAALDDGIRFREMIGAELVSAYRQMEGRACAAMSPPVLARRLVSMTTC
jgi:hypothetical protein